MKRLLGILLALLLVAPVAAQSPQVKQLLLRQLPVVSGASTTTWDPTNHGVNITLSPDKLTATEGGGGGNQLFRSLASHSSGQFYFEFTATTSGNVGLAIVGIGNSSASLNSFAGADNNAIGAAGSGNIWLNSGNPSGSPIQAFSANDVIAIAADLTSHKIWWKNLTTASGWNNAAIGSQNPAIGSQVGGLDYGGAGMAGAGGQYFATGSSGSASDVSVANFGATAYTGTPPTGFGNW